MDNNDLMKRLRYALRCDDTETARLVALGGGEAQTRTAAGWRLKDSEEGFIACRNADVMAFLAGLITDRRGPREEPDAGPWKKKATVPAWQVIDESAPIDNNLVLKQLRIALSLRSDDLHAVLKQGGSAISASESGALFRNADARNFRRCGDQVLRQFINGLVARRDASS